MPIKIWLFFFALKFSSLSAENFYVSEIFLNKIPWLELHNISEHSININKLKIEIQEGSSSPRVIETNFKPPLIFDDRLIISQQKNLGLGTCFNNDLTQIVLKDFRINKTKKIKICVSLNNQTSCTNLSSKLFYEGASLYKSAQNLWRPEPCLLTPGLYATPGLPERACILDPDFSNDLFNCEEPTVLINRKGSKPSIISALINPLDNLELTFSDDDSSDLWRMSFCSAPATSKLICYEHENAISYVQQKQTMLKLPNYSGQNNNKLRVIIRDLDGLSDSADLTLDSPTSLNLSKEQILKQVIKTDKNQFIIKLKLKPEEVPVNAQIMAVSGEVLAQRAFLKAGLHDLVFITQDSSAKLSLTSKNQNSTTTINLNQEHEDRLSCATHDSSFLYLLIYIAYIIRRACY